MSQDQNTGLRTTIPKVLKCFIIGMLAFISLISLLAGISNLVARNVLKEETVDEIVSTIEVNSAENTIDEWVYLYFETNYPEYLIDFHITQEGVSYCLDNTNFADFLRQKLKDYTSDILTGSGAGIMTSEEFMDFIEANRKVIETGSRKYADEELITIRHYLSTMDMFDDISLESICLKIGTPLSTVQFIIGNSVLFGCFALFVISILIIFLICRKYKKAIPLLVFGIDFLLVGILYLVINSFLLVVLKEVARRIKMGASLISSIVAPVSSILIVTCIICMVTALISLGIFAYPHARKWLSQKCSNKN